MRGKIGVCKFCLQEKKLIQAHVIPKCFQKAVKDDTNTMFFVRLKDRNVQPKNDMLFDPEILCSDCDNLFSEAENYTAGLFAQIRGGTIEPSQKIKTADGQDMLYVADLFKIKNCLLSILWRMSISKKEYFKSISLGPLEKELRSRLNTEEVLEQKFFPLSIISLRQVNNLKKKILCVDSAPLKYRGGKMYILHLPDFLILYNASKQVQFDPSNMSIRNDGFINIGEENRGHSNQYLNSFYKTL